MTRTAEQLAIEHLKVDEGLSLVPYRCTSGKLTIGYGRNLDDVGITSVEAELLLKHDVEVATRVARLTVGNDTWFDLTEARKAVLINMAFNLGATRFAQFKKTLQAIRDGDYETASSEMLDSRWARQVGARADRLAALMKQG